MAVFDEEEKINVQKDNVVKEVVGSIWRRILRLLLRK
jgi:hypothetical protein